MNNQFSASDPTHSVWVSASAGTGKTKILTDRVLRLLLSDVEIEKILCLTFTNAAATEMAVRINNICIEWQNNKLNSLEQILGHKPSDKESLKAKHLFSKIILSPHQLPIYTIHSFCQKILSLFPFEANIDPGFKVIDEMKATQILQEIVKDIINNEMDEYLEYLITNYHESILYEIINEIIQDRIYFEELFKNFDHYSQYAKYLEKFFQSKGNLEFWNNEITKKIQYFGIENFLINHDIEYLREFFLTQQGEPKKKLLNKSDKEKSPILEEKLYKFQQEFYEIDQNIKLINMIDNSVMIYQLAHIVITKYNSYKKAHSFLDYDDLIYHTKTLLTDSHIKDWVLYKLDGGISHLLVDEAQDTSPSQWNIIEAIACEFYSGTNEDNKNDRTIFIVGDEKQSIYSFQGADVSSFNRFREYLETQMTSAAKNYTNIQLHQSYRSGQKIIDFTNHLWNKMSDNKISVESVKNYEGTVEIWPIFSSSKQEKELFWPLIEEMGNEDLAIKILAQNLAQYIKDYINSGIILPSTQKPATASDFMILLVKRSNMMHEIISALKAKNVDVEGMDRMVITEHIAVKDILSIAKYALSKKDLLNNAAALKTPLINFTEQDLINWKNAKFPDLYHETISELALSLSVFEFFYYLIETMNFREILILKSGESTSDMLDELLNLAIKFEREFSTNLQEFIYWIESNDIEIKREFNNNSGVKVMTIHGAKGLESPIVILPDTTSLPQNQNYLSWIEGFFILKPNMYNMNLHYSKISHSLRNEEYLEYLRLLYVAVTRAKDHLILLGCSNFTNIPAGCFYNILDHSINSMDYQTDNVKKWIGKSVIFQEINNKNDESCSTEPLMLQDPKSLISQITAPHQMNNITEKMNQLGPLSNKDALNYGELIHKILEDSINTKNFSFSPSHPLINDLKPALKNEIYHKISQLFLLPEMKEIMEYKQIYTEIPIGYSENEIIKLGRIDLLAVKDDLVLIIDYKTDKKVPQNPTEIPINYINQLKFYANTIKKIYPSLMVLTKILWFENLTFTEIKQ